MEEEKKRRDSDQSSVRKEIAELENIPYPKCVFFILSTEACERFSYYGMRAILSLYLRHLYISIKGWDTDKAEDVSTIIYHTFVFLSYFTSIFGAFLSDSFLGKFRTIFYISIVYAIGQITLSLGAIPATEEGLPNMPQIPISYLGLILIGFGTGGIKPCVVSFGAEQFTLPQQNPQMQTFFGIFYAAINFGSMISTILTPIFRKTPCLGEDECYTLAFGVPAILMIIAIVFFVLGRPWYKILIPETNVVKDFAQAIGEAISKKRKATIKRDHWMDYAEERFGAQFVADIKAVLRIIIIFCMYPLFWALYDQQGSRWTFQASRMDGQFGSVQILPDQMQVINAALILIYIPIFDKGVYPLFNKFGMLKTPLQKIVTGGVLLAFSFIVSGFVELRLQKTYPHPPDHEHARLAFHNGFGFDDNSQCKLEVILSNLPSGVQIDKLYVDAGVTEAFKDDKDHELLPFEIERVKVGDKKEEGTVNMTATINILQLEGSICEYQQNITKHFIVQGHNGTTFFVYPDHEGNVHAVQNFFTDQIDKSESGNPWLKLMFDFPGMTSETWMAFSNENFPDDKDRRKGRAGLWTIDEENFYPTSNYQDVPGDESSKLGDLKFCIYEYKNIPKLCVEDSSGNELYQEYRYGGSFNHFLVAYENDAGNWTLRMDREETTEPNSINILWLLPQYFILTAGEVLFSITSLQFSFTQAPGSMKAVVQSLYLITTALGNLIDIIVVGALSNLFKSQASEFFFFATLMLLDMAGLAFLATRYKYVDYSNEGGEQDNNNKLPDGRRMSIISIQK